MSGLCVRRIGLAVVVLAAAGGAVSLTGEAAGQVAIHAQMVAFGFSQPTGVYCAPGDDRRLFVLEQSGRIKIVDLAGNPATVLATPFLNLSSTGLNLTSASGERGLLGLAFDPDYLRNGYVYVDFTTPGTNFSSQIERFTAVGAPFADAATALAANTADPASRLTMLSFGQPYANHNGGAMLFGIDGMLYVGVGDGGSAYDPEERAQNLSSIFGKILRLDVRDMSADDGDGMWVPDDNPFRAMGHPGDKVWAYGMRNPWRITKDRWTGDLWIADVGEVTQEEIDFQPAPTGATFAQLAGRNYGWDCREGAIVAPQPVPDFGCDPNAPGLTDPVKVYTRAEGACSITGGYVYRGGAMPALQGAYFHADYCGGWVKSLRCSSAGVVSDERDWTAQLNGTLTPPPVQGISSFGEDAKGELYFVAILTGVLYKIVPDVAVTDCNHNGVSDSVDIQNGTEHDWNHNGLPDSCECLCDVNGGGVTIQDLFDFLGFFFAGDIRADINGNGVVSVQDIFDYLECFFGGCG